VIFSGGLGEWHPETPAGLLMRDLAAESVPDRGGALSAMAVEGNSTTTFENLRFSFAIAEAKGYRRLALVSDPYHLTRARYLARYFGQPEIGLVAAEGFAGFRSRERETLTRLSFSLQTVASRLEAEVARLMDAGETDPRACEQGWPTTKGFFCTTFDEDRLLCCNSFVVDGGPPQCCLREAS